MQVDSNSRSLGRDLARDLSLSLYARHRVRQYRRDRRLRRLNAVLVPVTCLVCWLLAVEAWRVFR